MKGIEFHMDDIRTILARRGLEAGGRVQRYIDSEVLRLSAPYVPHDVGTLEKSGDLATDIGSGVVEWNTPYARYQYYGKVMVGSPPKRVTNTPLTYHGGGKRGKLWFERMKLDHKDDILRGAASMVGGKAT